MKRSIIIAVLAVLVTATMVVWMLNSESRISGKAIAIGSIQLVILVFAVLVVYKRWTAAKNKLPAEDEMSKSIRRRGAATSYYVSIYMWLAFMMFEERIDLERSTLIGAGILGMVIIYALSWVYHSYIRKSHD
jgi:ABC-type branched-subunit amino acid transport system permease subunit